MPKVFEIYDLLLSEPHTLIAGITGSGKTVVINGMLVNALFQDCDIWLCDPKMFELRDFRICAQVKRYANTEKDMIKAVIDCEKEMRRRCRVMEDYPRGVKEYQGKDLYFFIDELGDLLVNHKQEVKKPLLNIVQLGRRAKVHLIAATQRPSSAVLPVEIRANFTGKVGLRVNKSTESKLIIDEKGCESLPLYHAFFSLTGYELTMAKVPKYSDDFIYYVIDETTPAAENACITVA